MRRLMDDPQMPAELRQTLAQSHTAGHNYDALAKLAQLRTALSDPRIDPLPGPDTLLSGPSHGLSWHTLPSLKLLAKLSLVAVVVGGSAYVAWPSSPRAPAPTAAAASKPSATEAPAIAPATPAPPTPSARAEATALVEESPQALAHVTPQALSKDEEVTQPLAPPDETIAANTPDRPRAERAASGSRREIAQLVRIRALLDKDPSAAYKLAVRSEREFPSGVLRQERQAMIVLSLAKQGDVDEARRAANRFVLQYPQSPMRDMIEVALGR